MVLSNRAQISEQDGSYRRGLVLGLTMAEIAILIIFILLLALGFVLEKEHERRRAIETNLRDANTKISNLSEQISVLSSLSKGRDIEEFVRELIAARESARELKSIKSELTEAKELVSEYEEVLEGASPKEVAEALEEAITIKSILEQFGDKHAEQILKEYADLQIEKNRLDGQLANAQKKMESMGKGNEMPSCWATADGTVEYIYEVAVTSGGMTVRETILAHRKVDRGSLPVSMISLGQEVSETKFKTMVRPLYNWSVDKRCRFYVKVYDLTGPTVKELYKQRLKTVVGNFYRHPKIFKDF